MDGDKADLTMIDPGVRRTIIASIVEVENSEKVRVLYACESGSRAWGFPSRDSDYDVRFVYIRPKEWYLSIDFDMRRDVIERPVSNGIDLSGWDIRKALQLIHKSNPPLLEWMRSPFVYVDALGFAAGLRSLLPEYYSPESCMHHYLHMAEGNCREYLNGSTVWVKKYFYVLRPLLAVRWIEAGKGAVPMEFASLIDGAVDDPKTRIEILGLLRRKMDGDELDRGPCIPPLDKFIADELTRIRTLGWPRKHGARRNGIEALDALFLHTLDAAWRR